MPQYKHVDRDEWVTTADNSPEDKRLSSDPSWKIVENAPSLSSISTRVETGVTDD